MDTLTTAEYRDLVARRMPEAGKNGWQERVRRIATLEARATPEGAWTVYHAWQSRHSAAGFPDVFAWRFETRRGHRYLRVVVAELKRVGGKPTDEQRQWLRMFAWLAAGLVGDEPAWAEISVHVWTPLDEAEVRRVFLGRAG